MAVAHCIEPEQVCGYDSCAFNLTTAVTAASRLSMSADFDRVFPVGIWLTDIGDHLRPILSYKLPGKPRIGLSSLRRWRWCCCATLLCSRAARSKVQFTLPQRFAAHGNRTVSNKPFAGHLALETDAPFVVRDSCPFPRNSYSSVVLR